jgi:cell division protein FtsI (penicillin-binding protein 3)
MPTLAARPIPSAADRAPDPPAAGALRPRRNDVFSRAARFASVFIGVAAGFSAVAVQLVRLGLSEPVTAHTAITHSVSETFSRPDIVDRNGHLLATDVVMQSLFADPARLLSVDETLERLARVLPGIDTPALRRQLADRDRRFVWLRRGLAPATAQKVLELGLPGLAFKTEPHRSYPQGRLAGHLVGSVNVDNKGLSGIERHIDRIGGIERVVGEPRPPGREIRLTLDLAVQTALEQELAGAIGRYRAKAASAIVLDVKSGAVRAAASLPGVDPAEPLMAQKAQNLDRLRLGTYELGSIFKALTIAMALEKNTVTAETVFDVRKPIAIGRHAIKDYHAAGRPLTVEEIFIHSSNVGAGLIALEIGATDQRAFLGRLGLLAALDTEAGPTAAPQVPKHWGRGEVATIAFGHGLAVTPLHFARAGAVLVNGGFDVAPRFIEERTGRRDEPRRILSASTSAEIRRLMRMNVIHRKGSGKRADVQGYRVGGKTGTADLAAGGGYDGRAVVTSFFSAFPMDDPAYVVLVTLYDPQGVGPLKSRTAGTNAAPTAGRIIARGAPLLGVAKR